MILGSTYRPSYAYDHQNRRYKKTIGSSVTHYVWEGSRVVGEYIGSSGTLLVQYGYAGSRMISRIGSGTTQYFLSDRLSIRLALSDAGVVVGRQATLPFGEDFAESGTQEKHHFTSYERDSESGIDYALNRGYAPKIGQFQQADPYRPSGYLVDPQSWNRYIYTRNDPTNKVDPAGLEDAPIILKGWAYYYYGSGVPGVFGYEGEIGLLLDTGESDNMDPGSTIDVRKLVPPVVGKDRKKVEDANTRAGQLTQNAACDQALKEYGIRSLAALVAGLKIGEIVTQDKIEVPSGNIFDGRTAATPVPDDKGGYVGVAEYFPRNPTDVAITAFSTNGENGIVFLGSLFFQESPDDRAITLIHEAVHRGGRRDTDFGATREKGSHNLTALLKQKCLPH